MGAGVYLIAAVFSVAGMVVPADFSVNEAPDFASASSLPAEIDLRCSLSEGHTFSVSVDFVGQRVRLENGPNIPVSNVLQNGDRTLIRGRSDWFNMEAVIGPEISITLGEKESALQTLNCTRVTP
jgi:hypothetical protein